MLTYLAIARRYRPRWVVWENVAGVLSSNGGRDFGAFLRGLGECGYGFAYRVLDAQYTRTRRFPRAVPQRRRRVFVVGYLGDWRPAAAVLFDAEILRGNPPPRRKAGERTPARSALGVAIRGREGGGTAEVSGPIATALRASQGGGDKPHVITSHDPACTLTAREFKGALPEADLSTVVAHSLRGEGFDASEDGTGRGTPLVPVAFGAQNSFSQGDDVSYGFSPPLSCTRTPDVAFGAAVDTTGHQGDEAFGPGDVWKCLAAQGGNNGGGAGGLLVQPYAVRRLTPLECERLMGFPDDFTAIPYRNKPAENCPDGPRYKALGNSWAVNCADWLAERIEHVESILASEAA